jgi:hypothetical protein
MNDDRLSTSNEKPSPKKLHKPRRAAFERKPEEVITYTAECDDLSVADPIADIGS